MRQMQKDQAYLQALADGLGIRDTACLSVIMGPEELKEVLTGLTMADFDDGIRFISLHNHTTVSDGSVPPKGYLDNALRFRRENGYRSLILAITDHDDIDALPVILKQIQVDPKKYDGLRIVLGAELSASYFEPGFHRALDFEVLHYGINPFDKTYRRWLADLRHMRQKAMPVIFDRFQKRYPDASFDLTDFYQKHPVLKKGFGYYLAYATPRYLNEQLNDPTREEEIWDYFRRLGTPLAEDPSLPFWHTLDDIIRQVRRHGFGFLSLAHPYRIQLTGKVTGDGAAFLKKFLGILKHKGVPGIEVFYMRLKQPLAGSLRRMLSGEEARSETDIWVRTILDFATENNMIRTGGTDSHHPFFGSADRCCVRDLTALLQKYKPLIRQGYRVLNKEVTLGLPAPCMPPESAYRNTGIGSDCGAGARRIASFFGGLYDKILLGPMGETTSETGHSPYMSGSAPNPFLLPLEDLAADGLISQETLKRIYDIPKPDGQIDFSCVERVYAQALHEAYRTGRTKQSYPQFIRTLSDRYHAKAPARYIADLQVQIPPDTPGLKPSMFLKGYSLGCPPDYFSDKPQVWGFKIFDPDQVFDADGHLGPAGRVWRDLIDSAMKHTAGGLRIDHFIRFVNPYVISDTDPTDAVRLFSSPDHPRLGRYTKKDFSDITRQIVLACARRHGLKSADIYPEDVGIRPPQMDAVMRRNGLGRLLIAEFFEPDKWDHLYHLSLAKPLDVATLDTHDTPSAQAFFEGMSSDLRARFAWVLASDLRFRYTDDLCHPDQLFRMQWGALMASPARRVQAFFTSWTGQEGRYNIPEQKDQWRLRCVTDFEKLYFKNLARGRAYNPFDAICLAIYARGDDFYYRHEALVHQLRAAEEEILSLARDLIA